MTANAQKISTKPDPFEAFLISQAFRVGHLVITSGQAAIAPKGELAGVGNFDRKVEQTVANLSAVLNAAIPTVLDPSSPMASWSAALMAASCSLMMDVSSQDTTLQPKQSCGAPRP
jgi:enamine deaminase RidA (YjgF/YER057c/UK114 family)